MENEKFVYCTKCGQQLPEEAEFCVACGEQTKRPVENIFNYQNKTAWYSNKFVKIGFACAIGLIMCIVAGVFIFMQVGKTQLHKELKRDWSDYKRKGDTVMEIILDFSEDEIVYKLETDYSWLDTTVATYKYKVISGSKIKVLRYGDEWETFTIKFNDDKNIMTVTPALTGTEKRENWYNFN